MHSSVLLVLLCSLIVSSVDSSPEGPPSSPARRKRYVVFPEGSSFSIALCLTVHTLTPDNIFTEGVNWGISYDLPNESKPELDPFLQLRRDRVRTKLKYHAPAGGGENDHHHGNRQPNYYGSSLSKLDGVGKTAYHGDADEHHYYLQRRYRRNLYNKLEVVVDAMGFDGRRCVLRALCEASRRLMPRGKTLVEEMIRVVFALPVDELFSFEPEDHHAYARAYGETRDCATAFPECGFSLVDMALGRYSGNVESSSLGGRIGDAMLTARLARFIMK
ncbi:uncharacterized protein LOC106638590 [Copidosoma floridanum]|uniref:uncharacterized protein LOC106638590 n=1 Tax=Copidosoma floridanum TaxID=29053 RepID=UPI0006C97DD1|nr:uncharacterized protein LOC106638590 [Copidosoma floridanum]